MAKLQHMIHSLLGYVAIDYHQRRLFQNIYVLIHLIDDYVSIKRNVQI